MGVILEQHLTEPLVDFGQNHRHPCEENLFEKLPENKKNISNTFLNRDYAFLFF